jgi:hypothetical protein
MPRQTNRQRWEEAHLAWVATWDRLYPHAGPCGVCGWPDKRHRIADAITAMYLAEDDPDLIAEDFGTTADVVVEVAEAGAATILARRQARIRRDAWPAAAAT